MSLLSSTCRLIACSLAAVSSASILSGFVQKSEQREPRLVEPLLIDRLGDGFRLTSLADGVLFDLNGDGAPEHTAWTSEESDEAFLALDLIQAGRIENGTMLFGGLLGATNGFTALSWFERDPGLLSGSLSKFTRSDWLPNGSITEGDPLYSQLIFWTDSNHNGVSEGKELESAQGIGLVEMFTGVVGLNTADENGNVLRYSTRALVKNHSGVPVGAEVRSVRFAR